MSLCVNCGIATDSCKALGGRRLDDEVILSLVQSWVAPQTVNENDSICKSCLNHIVSYNGNKPEDCKLIPTGHRRVCIHCGRSLLRRVRSHQLRTDAERERRIFTVIAEWILPREVGASSFVCHSCWLRADRATRKSCSKPSKSRVSSSTSVSDIDTDYEPREQRVRSSTVGTQIVLPDYYRAVETQSKCFVEGCRSSQRKRIPMMLRKLFLRTYNLYVPPNNRLCDKHFKCESWDFLNDRSDYSINTFTADQIQDMLSLKEFVSNFVDTEEI